MTNSPEKPFHCGVGVRTPFIDQECIGPFAKAWSSQQFNVFLTFYTVSKRGKRARIRCTWKCDI